MRFTRYTTTAAALICATLLSPLGASAAASKEMQDLQRDVAMLSDQVTSLQKAQAAEVSTLQSAIQQAMDGLNKSNSTMGANLTQSLQNALKDVNQQLSSVSGLSVKVGNIGEDVSNLNGLVKDLQVSVNKQSQALNDIANQVKLLQAPPAAPPPAADGSTPGATASAPPPDPQTIFNKASADQDAGRYELAISGFREFLRIAKDDPNAIKAQYNVGLSYYQAGDLENAVKAFDATLEEYPKSAQTYPAAYLMKGMALKKLKKNQDAITSFRAVIRDFPKSDEAQQALQQLHSLNATTVKKK